MPRYVLYIAVTLDGFIASPDGTYDFLKPFDAIDYGFNQFLGTLGATIQGRTTYDQVHALPAWPYGDIPSYVVTSRETPGEHPPCVRFRPPDFPALVRELERDHVGQNIWLIGGTKTVEGFLDAGIRPHLEIYLIPILLGRGIPLFGNAAWQGSVRLVNAQTYPNGVVRLQYEPA